ncbi:MAG: MFS transporter [Dysgonamonadaceae bacterium]|jgi:predicted MFS family arabinose efflux permease|nr:MFS transporter [Dysgonamonadaceae bacterium]
MVEKIQTTLRNSKTARWTALLIVSFTMMWGYFLNDAMSPLMDMLGEKPFSWTSTEFGFFNSAYGWLNVILLMLFFGGLILDRMGVRFTGTLAAGLMVVGCAIKYYAIQSISPDAGTIFGVRTQIMVASCGFAIFAMGSEITGITISKIIVKWFGQTKQLALAMGIQVAIARLGTAFAMAFSPMIVERFSMSSPLLVSLIMLTIGFLSFMVYCVMDKKLDKETAKPHTTPEEDDEEKFKLKDVGLVFSSKGFWLIALLCVLFYSAVFPFLKFAASLMVNKYGVGKEFAGIVPALLPFGNMLMTPFFGWFYDKKGKGATLMIIGSLLLVIVHLLFAMPYLNYVWFAIFIVILLGVAFSLVPSAMWPSVAKIIPVKQLGTAFALIFWVQNIGLAGVPLLIGWVLSKWCVRGTDLQGATTYDYTLPMLIFALFGILAIVVAFLLKREDKRKGYGLEVPSVVAKTEVIESEIRER